MRFLIHLVAIATLGTVLMPMAGAQETTAPAAPIVKTIDIQYAGPATISKQRILANMRTTIGRPYSDLAVEEDIRNLYATGNISNVRIFGEPQNGGVRVVVVVQTRAAIKEVLFEGVTQVKPKALRKKIATKPDEQLSEATLEADRQVILDFYRDRNYRDTQVDVDVTTDEATNKAVVTFRVTESAKTTVSRIEFEGNTALTDKELRKLIVTRKATLISFLTKTGRIKDGQLMADMDAIRTQYHSKGYLEVLIDEPELVREQPDSPKVTLVYRINEGPQYTVGTVDVTPTEVFTREEVLARLSLKTDGIFSPQGVEADIRAVQQLYGAKGYVDVQVMPETTPAGTSRENILFRIEEGGQSYVQRVNISGNNRTKDKVIRREVVLEPGEIYNTLRVDASRARLNNLNYFEKVDIYPSETMVPGRKDVNVVVTEKRTGSLNFGAGFSSIDSLLGFVEVTQSNFDITNWPRFDGGGQRFRTRLQYGTERKDFVISLTEPYFLDYQLAVGGELFYHDAEFLSTVYSQRNYGVSLFTRKAINQFMSWRLDYRLEDITLYNIDSSASDIIKEEEGSKLKSQISPSIVWDSRDSVFLTRKGTRAQFSTYLAGGFLGGDVQIYGFNLEAAHYILLPWDTIFTINGEVAVVDTWGGGDRVPIFDRLYLGGSNNLRGFSFRNASPQDENNDPIGGNTLARVTFEYTFPVVERVRGAVFYDTGFVNRGSYDFTTSNLASDVGIGVRLDLPIGPVRIDYGIPMQNPYGASDSGKFNFNIGYQF